MRKILLTLVLILTECLAQRHVQAQASTGVADTIVQGPRNNTDSTIKILRSNVTQILRDQSFVKNTIVPVVVSVITVLVVLALLVLFLVWRRRQKRKIKFHEQQTREAKLRLQSIRSQLNPHFVYNALSGIQNLLNKKENDAANAFLTKFSRLSRRVLEDADKDLVTLSEEVELLEDYLQMEQLRFGFCYTITVDDDIDANNMEIPAMLVQPFVENAVKHGIVAVQGGHVRIRFENQRENLTVTIEDNGIGFDPAEQTNGAGLSLSKNRIALLNEIYAGTPVLLQVKSGKTGTNVTITLKDWLA